MTDRRCGTCRHWAKIDWRGTHYGECRAPLPASVFDADQDAMLETAGRECKCWEERKEQA